MNKDRQQIMRLVDTRNIFDEIAVVPSLLEIKEKDPYLGVTVVEGSVVSDFSVKEHTKPNMKKMIKNQNRRINQQLRQIRR